METKKIKNAAELRSEIKRLNELSVVQEKIIRDDIADIKESLKPKNILLGAIESATGIRIDTKNLFAGGISAGLLLFLRKYISKAEANAEDKIYEIADRLFERIRHFLSQFLQVRKHYPESRDENSG